jgi:hypothetical protein
MLPLFISFVASYVVDLKKKFLPYLLISIFCLLLADEFKIFDSIKYDVRSRESSMASNPYGIDFREGYFLLKFSQAFLVNVFGLHFHSLYSCLFFFAESLPVLFAVLYIFRSRAYIDQFVGFLIIFFFLYPVIWVMGVDVLGTAIRFRIFSYLALMISFCIIYDRRDRDERSTSIG